MKGQIKNTSLLFILSIFFFSCNKFLDKKPDTSLTVPQTLSHLQGLLNDFVVMNSQTPGFGEVSSDDYFLLEPAYMAFTETEQRPYTWQHTLYNFSNDWSRGYAAIYVSNYCQDALQKVERSTVNRAAWDNVKGSAHFFRAFHYLNLAWVYTKAYHPQTADKDMGLVLRLTPDFNEKSSRASVKETYDQIINDLKIANEHLPAYPLLHVAQPSATASYALLARTYLSMNNFDSALKYADLSLQLKSDLLDYNSTEILPGNISFKPFNPEIIFYATQTPSFSARSTNFAKIDTVLYKMYADNDKRKTVFFRPAEGYQRFKGSYAAHLTRQFSGLTVDENLLIRAECNSRLNHTALALQDLNTFLRNRLITGTFMPLENLSDASILERVIHERRKQLLMRGIRWADIKRLNVLGANIIPTRYISGVTYQLIPGDNRYALSLPQDVILQTGIRQN